MPRGALVPRAPAIFDTSTSSKRRWLQHNETPGMEQAHCQANSQAETRGQATEQEESRARS